MTNYREILRLDSIGLNRTEIATSCGCSRNTVASTLKRAAECGLSWPLPADLSDQRLAGILYPSVAGKPEYRMPDYEYVYREMQRKGVTLNLLWLEYVEKCRLSGDVPYQSTQFNKYYGEYVAKHSATMHLNHKPGEIMQVDWAGDTAEVIDNITGEILDMPPNHRQYSQWNGDCFRRWAGKIGPNTGMVVSAILSGYKVEQQGYKSCLGLLKLADKYSPQRLEGACTRALTFTPRPSLKNIQAILASGQDRLPVEESVKADTSAQYGFTRGADYYGGRDK